MMLYIFFINSNAEKLRTLNYLSSLKNILTSEWQDDHTKSVFAHKKMIVFDFWLTEDDHTERS